MAREESVTSQTSGRKKGAPGMSRAGVAATTGTLLASTGLVRKPLPVRLGNAAVGDVGGPSGGPFSCHAEWSLATLNGLWPPDGLPLLAQ